MPSREDDPLWRFTHSLGGLNQSAEAFQRAVASIAANQRWLDAIHESQRMFEESVRPIWETQARIERLVRSITEPFDRLTKSLEQLPARTKVALVRLGERGWYLDLAMPLQVFWELNRAIEAGDTEGAEAALLEYFAAQRHTIELRLRAWFPRRARLIELAFAAHDRGEFEVSVPLLLIQADGVCCDLIGIQLFKRRRGVPATAEHVRAVPEDTFRAALLHPLAHPLPISASAQERDALFDVLNRHAVLHGESVDYGKLDNSLRAISLLNYVASVLRRPPLSGRESDAA